MVKTNINKKPSSHFYHHSDDIKHDSSFTGSINEDTLRTADHKNFQL